MQIICYRKIGLVHGIQFPGYNIYQAIIYQAIIYQAIIYPTNYSGNGVVTVEVIVFSIAKISRLG